jgi:hypothetical protein
MKKTLALLALVVGLSAYAQENVSAGSVGILSTLKDANIGLSLENELKSSTSVDQIDGFYNKLEGFVAYKPTSVDTFKLSAGYNAVNANVNNQTAKFNFESPSFRYKRSNILVQDTSGVKFDSEARIYYYPDYMQTTKFMTGNTSWRNTFTRTFTPDYKLVTELRWDEYLRTNAKDKLARRRLMLTADPVVALSEAVSLTPEVSLNSTIAGTNAPNKEFVIFKPIVNYAFNKSFNTQAYWETTPMVSRDGKLLAKDFAPKGILGLVLTYTIL